MIKLSLTPDLRFANDRLIKRRSKIAISGIGQFTGTFSIMPTGSSSQVAITAQAPIYMEILPISNPQAVTVTLTANVIKTVHFKKDQATVYTGIPLDYLANDYNVIVKTPTPANLELYQFSNAKHVDGENTVYTLVIKRLSGIDAASDEGVEIADVVVATGGIVGNTTGFAIKGSSTGETVRIHALCNWIDPEGFNKNLESFKMVSKDHNALVLTLNTK